jgi:ADP-ribose pyrophosphatase YjhB (NUDIX family)
VSSRALDLGSATLSNSVMKFCPQCGGRVSLRTPSGDHLPRHVCDVCGVVHYQNPRVVVGCVPEHAGRILLCKRAIEPRRGYWTVPAGFMENGETLQQAAARESHEEARAAVEIGSLLSIVHVLHADQVHVFFRAGLPRPEFSPGLESLEVELVEPGGIPWKDLAFASTEFTLRCFLEDRAAGRDSYHFAEFTKRLPRP